MPRLAAPTRAGFGIAALAVLLYAGNLRDGFVGDDFDLIVSFHGKPWSYFVALLWSNESGDVWKGSGIDPALGHGYLRPLKIWLLALDSLLWGVRPFGWHLVSTALFAVVGVQVHALLRRALPALPALAFAGASAAVAHPLFSEVVPFITAREETLSLALGLAALLAFVRHREDGRSPVPFFVWLALALLAKESSAAFLPLYAAWDLAYGRIAPGRPLGPLLRIWVPVALLVAVYFGLRWLAFGNVVGGDGTPTHYFDTGALRFHLRFFRALGDPTFLSIGGAPGGPALAALLLLAPALAVAFAWRRIPARRRADLLFFGPLWYLGSTVLYSGVSFASRHHGLTLIGLALFATVALGALLDAGVLRRERLVAGGVLAAVVLLFLPVSLTTSMEFREAARRVTRLRGEIEARTADLPDGSVVLIPRAPQLIMPPYYFGWGLLSALRAPFASSDLADRVQIVNQRNRELNNVSAPMPRAFDRVVDLGVEARIPAWISARHDLRAARDLSPAPAAAQPPVRARPRARRTAPGDPP